MDIETCPACGGAMRIIAVEVALGTLTAGGVTWLLRMGSLLTGVFTAIPLWSSVDPLPILMKARKEEKKLTSKPASDDVNSEEQVEKRVGELLEHGAQTDAG